MAEPASFEAPAPRLDAQSDVRDPDAPVRRRSAARNALSLLYSQGLTWALSFILAVVQPRFIGPEGQGQLRLAASIWGIGVVAANLGTNNHVTLEIAKRGVQGARIVPTVLLMRLVAYVLTTVGVAGYLAAVGASRDTLLVFAFVGLSNLFVVVSAVARAGLLGYEHMGYVGVADVATKIAVTVVVLVVLFAGGDAVSVAAASVAGTVLNAVMMWRFLRRFPGTELRATLEGARGILRASVGFLVAETVLILYLQVDTVVMAALVDQRELGWYGTADLLYASLLFVPSILLSSLLPVIGRLHLEDPDRLHRLVDQSFSSLVLVGVPIGLGTVVIAEPLCVLLYGEPFRQSGAVLGVMGVVLIFAFGTILFGQVAIATGRSRFWNTLMIVAVVASIPLDLVLVPWMERTRGNGAIGGGLSYLVTESVMLVLGAWRIAPHVLSRPSLVRIAKIVVSGGLMFAAAWSWRDQFLAVPVAVGALVYGAMVLGLGILTESERSRIAAITARLRGLVTRG